MDRAIVERAVRALAALNTAGGLETVSSPVPVNTPATAGVALLERQRRDALAACGSSRCGGCYEVAPGVRIHPSKCGEEYRKWRERWEAAGKPQ
jgi:hypothetical protein